MKVTEIPMSMTDFEIMQHPFGWKAEYYGGKAVFTPREHIVTTQLNLTQRDVTSTYLLLPVEVNFKEQMIDAFFETFQDSVEFCNWPLEDIQAQATQNINDYFKGVRGEPLSFSIMAVEPKNNRITSSWDNRDSKRYGISTSLDNRREEGEGLKITNNLYYPATMQPQNHNLIGLILFIKNKSDKIHLDLLLVKPNYQRKGVGKQMISFAINQLYAAGITELYSAYHICNEISKKWHHSIGFQDIYDQYYIRLKYSWYRHEIWRHQQLNLEEQLESLIQQRDYWYAQLDDDWKY